MPERLALLSQAFDRLDLPFTVYHTRAPLDGQQKAREICADPACRGIIGMGGDGTLQEIAAGMADAFNHAGELAKITVPLGIFPSGSGNDFVMSLLGGKKRALSHYKPKYLPQAAQHLAASVQAKRTCSIDLITANETAYMNISNLGLDARIVRNALDLKERWGRYAYVAAVYKSIARHRNILLTIEVNGEVINDDFTLVAVCNGQYYGGGLHISPMATIDNGKIMLCLVRGMTRPKTMLIFPSLMIAQHQRLKAVSFIECEEVKITMRSDAEDLCMDGNLYAQPPGQTIHYQVRPAALDVFA